MYSIVILCAVLSVVSAERAIIKLSPEFLNKVEPIIKKCEAEYNPPENVFNNMLKGIAENEAGLKFSFCYLLESAYITKDGKAHVSNIVSFIKNDEDKETLKNYLEDCNKVNGSEPLELFRSVLSCYKDNPVVYFVA